MTPAAIASSWSSVSLTNGFSGGVLSGVASNLSFGLEIISSFNSDEFQLWIIEYLDRLRRSLLIALQ